MSWAVTGPIPSIVSSCSTVAVPRLIGPSGRRAPPAAAVRAAGRRLRRDHDLLAVGEPRREVDRVDGRAVAVAPPARSTASVTREPAGSR